MWKRFYFFAAAAPRQEKKRAPELSQDSSGAFYRGTEGREAPENVPPQGTLLLILIQESDIVFAEALLPLVAQGSIRNEIVDVAETADRGKAGTIQLGVIH